MFGRVRRAVYGAVSARLLPATDREAFVRDGRAGDGAARTFEGVSLMGLAARADPRLPHSRAGREGASREPSDAGGVRRGMVATAQGQGLAPGMGAGGDAVASGTGMHVRACQRRTQPGPRLSLRLFFRTCLPLVLGSVSCWFSASAADFWINPQVIPKSRQLACFGEQYAINVLARLIELQTVYNLPKKKAHEQLVVEIVRMKKKEFENCFVQMFATYPHESRIVLDVEELGLGSWGDRRPHYFIRATIKYKGSFYDRGTRNDTEVFIFANDTVVKKIDSATE